MKTSYKDKAAIVTANAKRAGYAAVALDAFTEETGVDKEDVICDLLCNIMHWAKLEGFDFVKELDRANGHYLHETTYAD